VGLVICISGSVIKGIIFMILAAICISLLDNFIRPLFLKNRIQVHPLIIFFAILGGLSLFGLNGLLLGPMIVILFFTILDMLVSKEEETENPITSYQE
jgi:predicted PurR-regulated permease PerM